MNIDNNEKILSKLEFVDFSVIETLFGVGWQGIKHSHPEMETIRFMVNGHGKRYHFADAARLIYPELTDFEVALLRIDINHKLKVGRKKK